MISDSVLDKLEYKKVLQYISNYAHTEGGKALLISLYPFNNPVLAKSEGIRITEAKEILIKSLPPPIEYLPNIQDSLTASTIEGAVLDSKKILEILRSAIISRNLFQYLKSNSQTAPNLFKSASNLFVDKLFEHKIQRIINEYGDIKENASPKLAEIRNEIREKSIELVKSVRRIIKELESQDITRDDYVTLRDGRIVIPVKVEHKRHIRGFIHSESSTGHTVYIEPEETLELNNEIISLSFAEKREIERLLKELTRQIGAESSNLIRSLKIIYEFDKIFACAQYSIEIIGSFPAFDDSAELFLSDARHPVLLKKIGREKTIPLNLKVENNQVILITGPNAGGKTVVLKTIGLLILLANSGIHIPVSPDSNIPFFDNVQLDIGDEQSIEDDLSTFSSHLSNINRIIQAAGNKSLILLDEIGTGTDPAEGAALAAAVLIMLNEKGATVFATTHHGSLKLVANELDGFENAAMEFDSNTLTPTYKFKQGIPGSSYAFEVAERIGVTKELLSLAKNYLEADKHKLEKFLVEIEAKSQKLEENLKSMSVENARLKGLSDLYKQKIENIEKEKSEILKQAKEEAKIYLADVNKKFERVIKEIRESNANPEVIKSSQKLIKELKDENKNLFKDELDFSRKSFNFAMNDFVTVKDTQASGRIVELDENRKKATLLVGNVKLSVKFDEIIPAGKTGRKEEVSPYSRYGVSNIVTNLRLDIRGYRAADAEFELIKFIDNSHAAGLERVEILHGKGTGALKKTVRDILSQHEKVKNFYFAPIEFGGDGITIAELK